MPADTARLKKLLVEFDERLADFEGFLDTIAEATGHDTGYFSSHPFSGLEGVKDRVYDWIQRAAPEDSSQ